MMRDLDWEGCLNARDLGGLRRMAGGLTRAGSVVRSDNPAYLSQRGWTQLHDYGIRTIVALRSLGVDDLEPDETLIPSDVSFLRVVVEDETDSEFRATCVETGLYGTPLYFPIVLSRWPHGYAEAVKAVAEARPGGVVVSCGRGCDRTGLLSFLLLSLAGAEPSEIVTDWWRSVDRLRSRDDPSQPSYQEVVESILARHGRGTGGLAQDLAASDVESSLRAAGLSVEDLERAASRLL